MLIDCDTCTVRGAACSHCLVSALFDPQRRDADLTAEEQQAIEVFALAGFEVEVIGEPTAPGRAPSRPSSRPRRRRMTA